MNNTNEALEVLQEKQVFETEDVYSYLLRVYNVQDDLTKCTLWEMVKDGAFNSLVEEKGLFPF